MSKFILPPLVEVENCSLLLYGSLPLPLPNESLIPPLPSIPLSLEE